MTVEAFAADRFFGSAAHTTMPTAARAPSADAMVAFPYATDWHGVVATLEDTLRLHHHRPGTLVNLDRYLHSTPEA